MKAAPRSCTKTLCLVCKEVDCSFTYDGSVDCPFFHLKAAPRSCTKTLCLVWKLLDCPFTVAVSVDCPFIPEGSPEELYEDALPGLETDGLSLYSCSICRLSLYT
jgi:hypothetical protein